MSAYFDDAHRRGVKRLQASFTGRSEWPTWLVLVTVYGGWGGTLVLLGAGAIRLPTATVLLVVLCAWYMSVQHELLHGHPTRSVRVNKLLGYAPLAVWYPYTLYRDSHLRHHQDEDLTVPGIDPESNYVSAEHWARMPPWQRLLWRARKTLSGRLLVGPPIAVFGIVMDTLREWRSGDYRYVPMWLAHGTLVGVMLFAIQRWTGMPAWYYLLVVSWPAQSLAMVRSLYEHKAAPTSSARIVINEAGPLMRLLYLNNNYHLVHHDLPALSWYQLPTVYAMRRAEYIEKCEGFRMTGGYGELLSLYAFRTTDAVVHPYAGEAAPSEMNQR
ncbi:fatty acid desaturase [Paraburkholderia xenovorans]|uniref:fatty acid desaturase n=1 Tax=Paraburkholderia xenovorans TaxID=36873 RepID=UPI0038BE18BB